MRYLLVKDNVVENVILAEPEFAESVGAILVAEDSEIGIGWRREGEDYLPPYRKSLYSDKLVLKNDGVDFATVVYETTYPDSPTTVDILVNGMSIEVAVEEGLGSFEVTPSGPGPITIACEDNELVLEVVNA